MSNTDPNVFDSDDTKETLYKAQRRYHTIVVSFFLVMVVINLLFVIAITVFEVQAKGGRELISDCLRPKGDCARNLQDSARQRGAAIVYCQKHLHADAPRDEVLDCVINFSEGSSGG